MISYSTTTKAVEVDLQRQAQPTHEREITLAQKHTVVSPMMKYRWQAKVYGTFFAVLVCVLSFGPCASIQGVEVGNSTVGTRREKAFCSSSDVEKEKHMEEQLRKKMYSICPKQREASSVTAAVDKIFGGSKWWKKTFDASTLAQIITSCIVFPERDCSGTAESCGVYVVNNKELRAIATQICKMNKAINFAAKDNFEAMLDLLVKKASGRKKEKKDLVVTVLADDVSVADLSSAFKKHGSVSGLNKQYTKVARKTAPYQDYNWSGNIPKESESCAFQNANGWGIVDGVRSVSYKHADTSREIAFQFVSTDKLFSPFKLREQKHCIASVLNVFLESSDVIFFNADDTSHTQNSEELRSKLRLLLQSLQPAKKKNEKSIAKIIALDLLPSHYPSKAGTGDFDNLSSGLMGVAPKFANCVYRGAIAPSEMKFEIDEEIKNEVEMNPLIPEAVVVNPTTTMLWYGCVPIQNSEGADWKNKIFLEEIDAWGNKNPGARKIPMTQRSQFFVDRCDLHDYGYGTDNSLGKRGDCSHYVTNEYYWSATMVSLIKSLRHVFDDTNNFKKIRGKKKLRCVRNFSNDCNLQCSKSICAKASGKWVNRDFQKYPYTCLVESKKCPIRYVEDDSES